MQRDPAAVAQHLTPNVFTDGSGSCRKWTSRVLNPADSTLLWPPGRSRTTGRGLTLSLPSRCRSMLVLRRFLARANSLSVTFVHRDILWEERTLQLTTFTKTKPRPALTGSTWPLLTSQTGCLYVVPLWTTVRTIPAEWSASCHWWFLAHRPCRAPTGRCRCSRCWRTGSCDTGFPDRPSVPVYWTDSGPHAGKKTAVKHTLNKHTAPIYTGAIRQLTTYNI